LISFFLLFDCVIYRHVLSNGTLHFPAYRSDAYRSGNFDVFFFMLNFFGFLNYFKFSYILIIDVHSAEYRCLASTATGALLSPPIIIRSGI
jgi:hypothetical protein